MSTLNDQFHIARATSGASGYQGSNRDDAPAINGWMAVQVENFKATSSDFAAQAYTDGQGHYKVSIRPSSTLGDWTGTNVAIGTGQWHPEFTDAIRFYGELILQIKGAEPNLDLDEIRASIDGSAFSQGAALLQAASKFWGTTGVGWDGPGAAAQMRNEAQLSGLRQEYRNKGLTDLQDNYTFGPGDFEMRQYSWIGQSAGNVEGVQTYVDPQWQQTAKALEADMWSIYQPASGALLTAADGAYELGYSAVAHSMDRIGQKEGFISSTPQSRQAIVQSNLAQGLSASGYAENSTQYEPLGSTGLAFQVSVYRNTAGELVEVRVPGEYSNGAFVAIGPPVSSVGQADGSVRSLGPAFFDQPDVNDPEVQRLIDELADAFNNAQTQVSPVILDLDGNGVQTVGLGAGVHFDHDANGFAQKSGWVGQGDGLLAANQPHWRQAA